MKDIFFVAVLALTLVSCGEDTISDFRQVERLARPAINEGLVITNDFLNAFNSIGPDLDLSPTAAPVVEEVVTVLTALKAASEAATLNPPEVADVAAGFVPDVMRIDTTKTSGYNADFVLVTGVSGTTAPAMLTGGRKLTDDVMDVTLSYLINSDATGASVGDNVTYTGAGGDPDLQGHQALLGSFPYLARPN